MNRFACTDCGYVRERNQGQIRGERYRWACFGCEAIRVFEKQE